MCVSGKAGVDCSLSCDKYSENQVCVDKCSAGKYAGPDNVIHFINSFYYRLARLSAHKIIMLILQEYVFNAIFHAVNALGQPKMIV